MAPGGDPRKGRKVTAGGDPDFWRTETPERRQSAVETAPVALNRRRRTVRAYTIHPKRMLHVLEEDRATYEAPVESRPTTRGECVGGARPCPFVGCRYHLFLDVNMRTGSIKFNFPDLEPEQLNESCALDIADRGGVALEDVGELTNITRERVRQIEVRAMARLEVARPLRELVDDRSGLTPVRVLPQVRSPRDKLDGK